MEAKRSLRWKKVTYEHELDSRGSAVIEAQSKIAVGDTEPKEIISPDKIEVAVNNSIDAIAEEQDPEAQKRLDTQEVQEQVEGLVAWAKSYHLHDVYFKTGCCQRNKEINSTAGY